MNPAIEVTELVKVYPSGKRAVDGLSFTVPPGQVFGLLGPNGSGKTTTTRILATLLHRTSGTVRIQGIDVERRPRDVRRVIGYTGQSIGVDDDLTARENLVLQGRLHGLGGARAAERAAELLELMSLTDVADVRTGRFSGGMRRRVDLVQALMHEPPVLFLDEPTTGMDPQSRAALWTYLDRLRRDGLTALLTTQYLEEADRACDQIAIIDEGRLLTGGTPQALKAELGADRLTVTVPPACYPDAARIVAECPEVTRIEQAEPLVLSLRSGGASVPEVLRRIELGGVRITTVQHSPVTLDDVFLRYTGHRVRTDIDTRPAMSAAFAAMHGRRPRS